MTGLIPQELKRLEHVRVFTPNVHAQWQEEENQRALIEWARKEEDRPLRPDRQTCRRNPFLSLTAFFP